MCRHCHHRSLASPSPVPRAPMNHCLPPVSRMLLSCSPPPVPRVPRVAVATSPHAAGLPRAVELQPATSPSHAVTLPSLLPRAPLRHIPVPLPLACRRFRPYLEHCSRTLPHHHSSLPVRGERRAEGRSSKANPASRRHRLLEDGERYEDGWMWIRLEERSGWEIGRDVERSGWEAG